MRVVNASFFYNEKLKTETDVLEQQYTITGWAEALERKGIEVIVLNRFYKDLSFTENNVHYQFLRDNLGGRLKSWQVPFQYLKRIRDLDADVIHLHHLTLSLQTFLLRLLIPNKTAIIIQHHGGKSPNKIKRILHNLLISIADGFFFTTNEQGEEWFLKENYKKIFPVMEGATFFNYAARNKKPVFVPKADARKKTQMQGAPVFLWVGRLDENKDPLTVLEGFQLILQMYPQASLYMIYSESKLINEVYNRIENNNLLKSKVNLLETIVHDQIDLFYRSADYFVLGSHYEGSGYALSEALRSGCIPVVTDIPSFRMMTNNGNIGALWEAGNKHSLAEAIISAMKKSQDKEAKACKDFFEKNLSFDSIASTAIRHYQQVIDNRIQNKTKVAGASHA